MSKRGPKVQKSRAALARAAAQSLLPLATKKQVRQLARQEAAVLLNPRRATARPRRRIAQGGGGNYMATDGLTHSRVHTNTSVIEDRFQLRREKIADIAGATAAFTAQQSLYINPGNSVLFPIFSQIAATYEEYRVNFLRFVFETEAYTASGTTQSAGIVCLATNFDPDDNAFSNLTQMENYCGSVKGPPYAPIIQHDVVKAHRLRRARRAGMADLSLNNYFVYSSANGAAPSSSTAKFYDIGLFQLAVANMVGTGTIGELYVEYSFTMIRPKQQTPLGQNLIYAHITSSAAATAAAPLGTTGGVLKAGSTLTSVATTTTFTLPVAGTYHVSCSWAGATITSTPTLSLGSNITSNTIMVSFNPCSSFTASRANIVQIFNVAVNGTGAANTLTIGGLATMTNADCDVFISQVSSGITFDRQLRQGVPSPARDTYGCNDVLQRMMLRLALLERGTPMRRGGCCSGCDNGDVCCRSLGDDDAKSQSDDGDLHQEPELVREAPNRQLRRSPACDLVIRSDGTVENLNGGLTSTHPRVSLSKSVLGSLIGLP